MWIAQCFIPVWLPCTAGVAHVSEDILQQLGKQEGFVVDSTRGIMMVRCGNVVVVHVFMVCGVFNDCMQHRGTFCGWTAVQQLFRSIFVISYPCALSLHACGCYIRSNLSPCWCADRYATCTGVLCHWVYCKYLHPYSAWPTSITFCNLHWWCFICGNIITV